MSKSPHLPLAHIDLARIRKNYRFLQHISAAASPGFSQAAPPTLLPGYGERDETPFVWPSQLAVIKADAYGHGHIRVAEALLEEGATLFASGSVQEAVRLRQELDAPSSAARHPPRERQHPAIISLLGLVRREDVFLCADYGIIPLVHSLEQLSMLEGTERPLAIAVKCNTGMYRLGFNEAELPSAVEGLKKLPWVRPVIALSHLHSADTRNGRDTVLAQSAVYARMLHILRASWPTMAASLGNSAGTLLARDIANVIGPHICRPGIALYGGNPFVGTSLASLGSGLLPAMAVSAPILATRILPKGAGIGYGHTHIATEDSYVGIVAAGYADCFPRSMSGKGVMCVDGVRAPVIGRVSMQMTAVNLSGLSDGNSRPRPDVAWIMGGPYADAVSVEELAHLWGTISYEVLCLLGNNERVYSPYPDRVI
jgi:alanine racemase